MAQRDGQESVRRFGSVVSRTRPTDVALPAALRAFPGPRVAWFAPGEPDVVGCGEAETLTASGADRFGTIRADAASLLGDVDFGVEGSTGPEAAPAAARPRLVGGFAFHGDHAPAAPWTGFSGARFVLPRVQVVDAGGRTWLTVTAAGADADPDGTASALDDAEERIRDAPTAEAPPPGIVDVARTPERDGWRRQVEAALSRIESGDLEKVVLAQTLRADLRGPFRLRDALSRLGGAYPDCYRFAVDPGLGATFFGATPERLVSRRGSRVETEALAGSIGRGGTAAEDGRLARQLTDSPKIRHEHELVVGAIRDQLEAVAAVSVGEASVRKLANVQHLETPVRADLDEPAHALSLVERLHPTPAVGGLPPKAAQRTIRETERFDRGWYAGPVGWFDSAGDGTFAVGIRSAVASGSTATLFAGNGIVADSDPDDEWDELQLKYRPILDQLR